MTSPIPSLTDMDVVDKFPERSSTISNDKQASGKRNTALLSISISKLPDPDSDLMPALNLDPLNPDLLNLRPLRRSLSTPEFVDSAPTFYKPDLGSNFPAVDGPAAAVGRRPSDAEAGGRSDSYDEEPIDPMKDIKQRKRLVRKRPKLQPSGKSFPDGFKEEFAGAAAAATSRPTRPLRSRTAVDKKSSGGATPAVENLRPSFVDDIFPLEVSDDEDQVESAGTAAAVAGSELRPNQSGSMFPAITMQAPTPEDKQESNRYQIATPTTDFSPLPRYRAFFSQFWQKILRRKLIGKGSFQNTTLSPPPPPTTST